MPVLLILPKAGVLGKRKKTDVPFNIVFPWGEDSNLPPQDVPIVVVYNNIDHYCGTKLVKKTFRDGLDTATLALSSTALLLSRLQKSTQSSRMQKKIAKQENLLKNVMYELDTIFKREVKSKEVEDEDEDEDQPRKKKLCIIPRPISRQKVCPLTDCHCPCGLEFLDKASVKNHIELKHKDNWNCIQCPTQLSCRKTLRRHVLTKHLNFLLHYCWYCDFGSNELHQIQSHRVTVHGKGKMFTCPNEFCASDSFSSAYKLKLHVQYCGRSKCFQCPTCKKRFKRRRNVLQHFSDVHHMDAEDYPDVEEVFSSSGSESESDSGTDSDD